MRGLRHCISISQWEKNLKDEKAVILEGTNKRRKNINAWKSRKTLNILFIFSPHVRSFFPEFSCFSSTFFLFPLSLHTYSSILLLLYFSFKFCNVDICYNCKCIHIYTVENIKYNYLAFLSENKHSKIIVTIYSLCLSRSLIKEEGYILH